MNVADKIIEGYDISKKEALELVYGDLNFLISQAEKVKEHYNKNKFNVCGIVNGKSGNCQEDCKYCAQSVYNNASIEKYPLISFEKLLDEVEKNKEYGIGRMSIVTSGKKLSSNELDKMADNYSKLIKKTGLNFCASHGLLGYEEFKKLKKSGVNRYHNNLETSRKYFPNICTTHTYDDKLNAIMAAKKAGLEICSGGIIGLGETMEDRIDMAIELRNIEAKSIPINILSPIEGTYYENMKELDDDEILRTFAIFRLINPKAYIRYAAGRANSKDKGKKIFKAGANAAISGNLLTIMGVSVEDDLKMIRDMGFEIIS